MSDESTKFIIPKWSIHAGVLTTWVVFSVTKQTGVLAGASVELVGNLIACSLDPISGSLCKVITQNTKQHIVNTSSVTALVASSVAGIGVISGISLGHWICCTGSKAIGKVYHSVTHNNEDVCEKKDIEPSGNKDEGGGSEIEDAECESESDYILINAKDLKTFRS